jgi:hypothetical protein
MTRPMMSVALPAGKAMMTRTGRVGNDCAAPAAAACVPLLEVCACTGITADASKAANRTA